MKQTDAKLHRLRKLQLSDDPRERANPRNSKRLRRGTPGAFGKSKKNRSIEK